MSAVRRLIAGRGITFSRAMVSNSLCCPARAGILLGAYSHTTRIYTNTYVPWSPHGAWPLFKETGDEQRTIARALHDAGYRTALFGKYLNEFRGRRAPVGWDRFAAFVGEGDGGAYYDYSMFTDGPRGPRVERHGSAPGDYSTTVIERKSIDFLRSTPAGSPFFLYAAPYAPHSRAIPADRDAGSFARARVRLNPAVNEKDVSDKPAYIRRSPVKGIQGIQAHFINAYEALASVDRMVGRIVGLLQRQHRARNTVFVFTSDNGVAYGEHHWMYKMTPYDESIRVPLMIRYDPLTARAAGSSSGALVANFDLAPTFADLAGIPFIGVGQVDGRSLVPLLDGAGTPPRSALLLEHLDFPTRYHVPTYCGTRTRGWLYVRYADGFQELYDLTHDPHELRNIASKARSRLRTMRRQTRSLCRPTPPGYSWS
jgi:arylsulfatase A-like enzyme